MIRLAIVRRRSRPHPLAVNDNQGGPITREHRRLGIMLEWWSEELAQLYRESPRGSQFRTEFAEACQRVRNFRQRILALG